MILNRPCHSGDKRLCTPRRICWLRMPTPSFPPARSKRRPAPTCRESGRSLETRGGGKRGVIVRERRPSPLSRDRETQSFPAKQPDITVWHFRAVHRAALLCGLFEKG